MQWEISRIRHRTFHCSCAQMCVVQSRNTGWSFQRSKTISSNSECSWLGCLMGAEARGYGHGSIQGGMPASVGFKEGLWRMGILRRSWLLRKNGKSTWEVGGVNSAREGWQKRVEELISLWLGTARRSSRLLTWFLSLGLEGGGDRDIIWFHFIDEWGHRWLWDSGPSDIVPSVFFGYSVEEKARILADIE